MSPQTTKQKWSNYQHAMLIVLLMGLSIAYIDRINLSVVLPVWIKEYNLSPTFAGLLASVFQWSYCLSLLFVGPLIDKLHPRRIFPIGVGVWSFATALSAVGVIFLPVLTVARALLGLGESTMIPSIVRLIPEIWKKTDWGKVTGVTFSGSRIGLTIGAPLSATILAMWGWQMVFYITGLIGFVWVMLFLLTYRLNKVHTGEMSFEEQQPKLPWRKLLVYRSTWALMVGQSGYLYIFYVFVTWLPSYFVIERKMTALQSGFTSMLPFLVAVFTIILGGWIADKWLSRGGNISVVRKTLICSGLFLATLFVIIAAYSSSTVVALVFLILAMGALGLTTANMNILAADIAPRNAISSLSSLQNFGGSLVGSLAPIVTGYLLSVTHSFQMGLLVAGAVSLVFGVGGFGLLLGKIEPIVDKDSINLQAAFESKSEGDQAILK